MLQVTCGALYAANVVRAEIPAPELNASASHVHLKFQFADQTARYQDVPFQLSKLANKTRITCTIPASCSDFKTDPPKLLTMPIKNEIRVFVDTARRPP